ncbi:polyketide synthase PKS [Mannheimia sp. USDA-ARS-USMARC-1261]|uniref:DsbA family oxidoreductase n=1 Tax=Mannheimia sp. USDA-ARS-USMARC-1261 TaxID=1432056 RepID=UPI0003E37F9A|nr:DsbA family oxidoreductase [Mannheimia sp. USDA-ARS-USMARC-1261]AHG73177.1 polyketide synthase PKS [Mannheimia sp. USDA-ARS-USMARC-1261]
MKIEVWSDFACPFCYIGKRHLEQALAQFEGEVEVIFRAFELDPHANGEPEGDIQQRLMQKYQKTAGQADEMINYVEEAGKQAGLDLRYRTTQYTRTFEAHRLAKFAESKGLGEAMVERLFKAYFTDNTILAKRTELIGLALEIGLERDEVAQLLTGDDFGHEVREDERVAHKYGIHSVPFFVIDEKLGVSGAQPPEVLLNAIKQALQKIS